MRQDQKEHKCFFTQKEWNQNLNWRQFSLFVSTEDLKNKIIKANIIHRKWYVEELGKEKQIKDWILQRIMFKIDLVDQINPAQYNEMMLINTDSLPLAVQMLMVKWF